MLFNSWQFLVFYFAVFFAFYLVPNTYRWMLLLIASYVFYASWNAGFLFLILITTGVTYFSGRMICRAKTRAAAKKAWVAIGVLVPLLILFFFKYFNFFAMMTNAVLRRFSIPFAFNSLSVLLPVGISFYTFQSLSYVIDVYRNERQMERHLGMYALYISFFPQLIAGPIERANDILPQLHEERRFEYESVTYGMKCMAWGYFMKIVIADILGPYVDTIYNNVLDYSGFVLVIASVLFVVQVYCDFAGYSLIALGIARTFGYKLSRNFDSPFYSRTLKEFWRRWHITLGTWFKDYLFYPIIRSRFCEKLRTVVEKRGGRKLSQNLTTCIALYVVWILNGIWHGAGYAYVEYGFLVGTLMTLGLLAKKLTFKQSSFWIMLFQRVRTFSIVTCIFVFIRAKRTSFSRHVFLHALDGIRETKTYLLTGVRSLGMPLHIWISMLICFAVVMLFDYFAIRVDPIQRVSSCHPVVRWVLYVLISLAIAGCFVFANQIQSPYQFIYFQF